MDSGYKLENIAAIIHQALIRTESELYYICNQVLIPRLLLTLVWGRGPVLKRSPMGGTHTTAKRLTLKHG